MPFANYGVNKWVEKKFEGWDKRTLDALEDLQDKRKFALSKGTKTERKLHDAHEADLAADREKKLCKMSAEERAKEETKDETLKKDVHEQVVHELENGGEAGLHHLGPLADQAGAPIIIKDKNGRHIATIGRGKPGKALTLQHVVQEGGKGHWSNPNNPNCKAGASGRNNCLFDAVADQLPPGKKIDGQKLRENVTEHLKKNPSIVHKHAGAIARKQYLMGGMTRENVPQHDLRLIQEYCSATFTDPTRGTCLKEGAEEVLRRARAGENMGDVFSVIEGFKNDAATRQAIKDEYSAQLHGKHKPSKSGEEKLISASERSNVQNFIKILDLAENHDKFFSFHHRRCVSHIVGHAMRLREDGVERAPVIMNVYNQGKTIVFGGS